MDYTIENLTKEDAVYDEAYEPKYERVGFHKKMVCRATGVAI